MKNSPEQQAVIRLINQAIEAMNDYLTAVCTKRFSRKVTIYNKLNDTDLTLIVNSIYKFADIKKVSYGYDVNTKEIGYFPLLHPNLTKVKSVTFSKLITELNTIIKKSPEEINTKFFGVINKKANSKQKLMLRLQNILAGQYSKTVLNNLEVFEQQKFAIDLTQSSLKTVNNSLKQMPKEIWLEVFGYLTDRDVLTMLLVSKYFYALLNIDDSWKMLVNYVFSKVPETTENRTNHKTLYFNLFSACKLSDYDMEHLEHIDKVFFSFKIGEKALQLACDDPVMALNYYFATDEGFDSLLAYEYTYDTYINSSRAGGIRCLTGLSEDRIFILGINMSKKNFMEYKKSCKNNAESHQILNIRQHFCELTIKLGREWVSETIPLYYDKQKDLIKSRKVVCGLDQNTLNGLKAKKIKLSSWD